MGDVFSAVGRAVSEVAGAVGGGLSAVGRALNPGGRISADVGDGTRFGFDQPHWLWLLVLVPVVLLLGRGWLRRMAAWRRGTALVLRTLLLSLLIVSLARPSLYWPDSRLSVAFVVDESDSIGEADRAANAAWLDGAMGGRQPDDKVSVVRFGRHAVADSP